jgi:membrane-anchored glycerophosphoryl diester phosphodiesterase (GDPDase)
LDFPIRSHVYLGRRASIAEAYRKIRGSMWRVIGVSLAVGIRVLGFLMLLVTLLLVIPVAAVMPAAIARNAPAPDRTVGAIALIVLMLLAPVAVILVLWFTVRYAVAIPAVVLENSKVGAAVRRSVELSKGRRWQGLLVLLLGVVISYAMVAFFQGPFYAAMAVLRVKGQLPLWLILSMTLSSSIAGIIAGPVPMIIFVIFYYDLRIRKEAFDLQQMMAALPEAPPGAEVSPA